MWFWCANMRQCVYSYKCSRNMWSWRIMQKFVYLAFNTSDLGKLFQLYLPELSSFSRRNMVQRGRHRVYFSSSCPQREQLSMFYHSIHHDCAKNKKKYVSESQRQRKKQVSSLYLSADKHKFVLWVGLSPGDVLTKPYIYV